ncbi:MAG: putative toxin-antitoxin system toxin component, PIN family [Terracidiphilus sp.]
MYQIVLDTNVLVAAMRSKHGASYRLLGLLGDSRWRLNLTVPIALEYEAVLKRDHRALGLTEDEIDNVLDGIFSTAGFHRLYFTWRPVATDPDDDLVLEAAIASHSDFIVTFNTRDFMECRRFGIQCQTPKEFPILIKELP